MTTPRRYTVQEALDLGLDEVLDLNRKYVNETLVAALRRRARRVSGSD